MADDDKDLDARLSRLGDHVRRGQSHLHPMPQETKDKIEQVVDELWEQQERARKAIARAEQALLENSQTAAQERLRQVEEERQQEEERQRKQQEDRHRHGY